MTVSCCEDACLQSKETYLRAEFIWESAYWNGWSMNGILESTCVWILLYRLLARWPGASYFTSLSVSVVLCRTEPVTLSCRVKWDIVEKFLSLFLCCLRKSSCRGVSRGHVKTPQYFPTGFQWYLACIPVAYCSMLERWHIISPMQ